VSVIVSCESLNLVHELVEELFDVHLFHNIHWVSIPVFYGMAKLARVYILLCGQLKGREHILQLVEQVVFWGHIKNPHICQVQYWLAKPGDCKELLEQCVHVSDSAQVLYPYEP
jgi:hypothetical protein